MTVKHQNATLKVTRHSPFSENMSWLLVFLVHKHEFKKKKGDKFSKKYSIAQRAPGINTRASVHQESCFKEGFQPLSAQQLPKSWAEREKPTNTAKPKSRKSQSMGNDIYSEPDSHPTSLHWNSQQLVLMTLAILRLINLFAGALLSELLVFREKNILQILWRSLPPQFRGTHDVIQAS